MWGKLINLLGLPKNVFLSKKEPQTKSQEKASLPPQFPSPGRLAASLQHLSPTLCFKGWRKTKRLETGLANVIHVSLNEYPLPLPSHTWLGKVHFDWGFDGYGARSLASAMLEAYFTIYKNEPSTQDNRSSDDLDYYFTKEVVEKLPLEQWELSSEDIHDWLDQRRK